VQLEHVIYSLKDKILFGEVTPAMISGGSTCTARQAVEYILRQQSDWVLGEFSYSVTNPYKFDGDSLFDCLETVTDSLDDAWWSYDLSRYPFRLNITRRTGEVGSELRAGRNMRTITRTIDRSGMYTRFYPIGKDDLHLAGTPYVERNANLYGVIEHTETDTSRETDGELRSWANEKLARHAEPVVNIEVEGFELVQSTGEPLDKLRLGRMCRVPLPEFGTTITERIVSLNYPDKVHQTEVVKITLANNRDDITRIIADNIRAGGRSGRGAARQAKEDHAWFEDTDTHVAMCAEGIVGTNPDGTPNWARLSQIIVDGTGIHQMVQVLDGQMETAYTRIDQNEDAITAEATRASEAEGVLSGRLTVAADAISAEVTRATTAEGTLSGRITVTADAVTQEVNRAKGAENSLSGRITTEAGKISLVVEEKDGQNVIKAASIVTAVNSAGSSVTISGDHVAISGNTTVSGAFTVDGSGYLVVKKSAVFQGNVTLTDANGYVQAKNLVVNSGGHVRLTGSGTGEYYDLTATNIQGFIKSASVSGDTLTLTPVHGDDITFTKAASLSGTWSSNTYTVTASPQGSTISTSVSSRFNAASGAYYIESNRSADQDAPSISGSSITYQMANNNGTIELQDTSGNRISNTPTLTVPSGGSVTLTGAWTNNTYTVSATSGSISGTVPSTTVGTRFKSGNGSYYIETYRPNDSGAPSISSSSTTYKLGFVTTGAVQIQNTSGTRIADTPEFPIWWGTSQSEVHHQGTLAYDTLYGLVSGGTALVTWRTPAAPSHNPNISVTFKWTGSISGYTSKGSAKASELANTYILIDATCGGVTNKYYLTINA
jgi:phage minor structural protein